MPELREYQANLWVDTMQALCDHRSVLMQLPTGGGKSVVLSEIAQDWEHGRIWWLTHRRELETQSGGHLQRAGRHDAVVTSPIRYWNRIQSGEYRPTSDDLLILDEAHHAAAMTWERAITDFPGHVLGATATPWRLSKREGLDHLFDALVCGPQVSQLMEMGHLAPARVLVPHKDERIQGSGNNGGDYSELSTWNSNDRRIMVESAIDWLELHNPNQAILYACGEEHARALLEYLSDRRKCALLTARTDTVDRKRIESEFRAGTLDTLINIAILTEGVDVPEVDCVVLTRPTKSLALYLQMIGRALRPKDKPAIILDCCALSTVHGLPEDDRQWSLAPRNETEGAGASPAVVCECGVAVHPMQQWCPGCDVQRWRTCERCSKPIFLADNEDEICERCDPTAKAWREAADFLDDYGNEVFDKKRERPILGWTKVKAGEYAGLFAGIWRYNVPAAPILQTGQEVTMMTKEGKKQRTTIVELIDNAPWGHIYATAITVRDMAKNDTTPADDFDYKKHSEKFNNAAKDPVNFF